MKLVLLSHCILNQSIRAVGVKNKTGEGVLNEVLNELNRSDISLFQMPCTEYLWEGLERRAAGRQKYDNAQYREICKKTAREVASYVESFKDERGGNVSLVLGLDGSPSCGVNFSMNYGEKVEKPGIFFEELMREMTIGGIKPAYVGVSTFGRGIDYTIREIKRTLL